MDQIDDTWKHFSVISGLVWVGEGGFGTLLGYFAVTLWLLWAYYVGFGSLFDSLLQVCDHFGLLHIGKHNSVWRGSHLLVRDIIFCTCVNVTLM